MTTVEPIAVRRQREIDLYERQVAHKFTQLEQGIVAAASLLERSRAMSDETPISPTGKRVPRAYCTAISKSKRRTNALSKKLEECMRAMTEDWAVLQTRLRTHRYRAFAKDYVAERGATLLATDNENNTPSHVQCSVCVTDTATHSMRCCKQLICENCISQSSFESSQHGTNTHAACPFCRGRFAIYKENAPTQRNCGKRKRST